MLLTHFTFSLFLVLDDTAITLAFPLYITASSLFDPTARKMNMPLKKILERKTNCNDTSGLPYISSFYANLRTSDWPSN